MRKKILDWLTMHKKSIVLLLPILVIAATVSAVNMANYPQRFKDEGTYISQAWAIEERGTLTHYTYWYDHPPLGWVQIAGYTAATQAIDRNESAVTAGREFMLVLHLASVALVFLLARRLSISPIASAIATLAYALSPLAVEFGRYVFIDNVALPWLLGAFVLALSPKKDISRAVASAVCMSIAILSKETMLVMLPVLLYALWINGDTRNRRYVMASFLTVFFCVSGMYAVYAVLKSELFPSDDQVSLVGTFIWQLFSRDGGGSVFDATSKNNNIVTEWLQEDRWLLLAGIITMPIGLFFTKLRILSLALLVNLALLPRTGWLPLPFVVVLLPFAALMFAGALDESVLKKIRSSDKIQRIGSLTAVAALTGTLLILVAPSWQSKLHILMTSDRDYANREIASWVNSTIGQQDRVVVESGLWTDIANSGASTVDPVWLYKTETDPEVIEIIGGWQGIDYVVITDVTLNEPGFAEGFPLVSEAISNGTRVATFGDTAPTYRDDNLTFVYKVNND